jgi:hypothetical protein
MRRSTPPDLEPDLDWLAADAIEHPWRRLATKIGLFILAWSQIDQRLDYDLWLVRAGTEKHGAFLSTGVDPRLEEWREAFAAGFRCEPEISTAFFETLRRVADLRNDLAHNVRSVGAMQAGRPAWMTIVRANRNFRKQLRSSAGDADLPREFDGDRVEEEELDAAMVIVKQLFADLIRLGSPMRRHLESKNL